MRSILVTLALLTGVAAAEPSQHSQKDAARLSAKLDAILRNADHPKRARPRKDAPAKETSKEAANDAANGANAFEPVKIERSDAAPRDNAMSDVIVHAMRIAFDPDEWALHLRQLPTTPAELEAHLRRLPRTPDEFAAHLRTLPTTPDQIAAHLANLPRSPADVDAHLRRLDAALRHPRH